MMRGLFLILLFLSGSNPADWELKKNEHNIKVYTRKVSTSDFKELQCKTTVKASLSSVISLLTDAGAYTHWVYACTQSYRFKHVGKTESWTYQRFKAPWPVADRDVVAVGKIVQDKKTKIVILKSEAVSGIIPEKKDVVRIKKFHSSYTLIPKQGGFVEIHFEMGSEPGGIVPAWLVNMVAVKGPFETHQKMAVVLNQPVYKNAKLDFISEL